MEQFAWIFWVLLGVALIVAETFTLGFVLLWFGVGALAHQAQNVERASAEYDRVGDHEDDERRRD